MRAWQRTAHSPGGRVLQQRQKRDTGHEGKAWARLHDWGAVMLDAVLVGCVRVGAGTRACAPLARRRSS